MTCLLSIENRNVTGESASLRYNKCSDEYRELVSLWPYGKRRLGFIHSTHDQLHMKLNTIMNGWTGGRLPADPIMAGKIEGTMATLHVEYNIERQGYNFALEWRDKHVTGFLGEYEMENRNAKRSNQ